MGVRVPPSALRLNLKNNELFSGAPRRLRKFFKDFYQLKYVNSRASNSPGIGISLSKSISSQVIRFGIAGFLALLLTGCSITQEPVATPTQSPTPTQIPSLSTYPILVALGDFGSGDSNQEQVAKSIVLNNPEWFVSLGDNVYSSVGYSVLIGSYYGDFINNARFLPATGNHDYLEGIANYDAYFKTSELTHYYKKAISPDIELFVLDSEAALQSADSMNTQRAWLEDQISKSVAKFKFVVIHHPPFSSGKKHGSNSMFQWNFSELGVTAVLSGHEHLYERLTMDQVTYLVSGAGGKTLYKCGQALKGQEACIDNSFGALYFTKVGDSLRGEFRNSEGVVLDSFVLD